MVAGPREDSKKVTSNEEIAQGRHHFGQRRRRDRKFLSDAMKKVGTEGVITLKKPNRSRPNSRSVEGMQFDRGYISPYSSPTPTRCALRWKTPTSLINERSSPR